MKKIQNKIVKYILITVLIVAISISGVSIYSTYTSTKDTLTATISEAAKLAAVASSNAVSNYTYVVTEISTNGIFTNPDSTIEEKAAFLAKKTEEYYMVASGIAGTNGINYVTGEDISAQEYYKQAMQGKTYMSTPYISEDKKSAYIIVSAPVLQDGTPIDIIYFVVDTNVLDNTLKSCLVGEKGSAYILDKTGTTIAYTEDYNLVLEQSNSINDSKADPSDTQLANLASIEQKMVNGDTGFGEYVFADVFEYQGYAPIPNTDGWSVAVTVNRDEFMASAYMGIIIIGVILIVILTLSIFISRRFGSRIGKPIELCVNRLTALSQGDLTSPVPDVKTNDETKLLADSTSTMVNSLNKIIMDISHILNEMAKGNITVAPNVEYPGDFHALNDNLLTILSSLNSTLLNIRDTSNQVTGNSEQVSNGAQILAQGATQQASAVQELSASISHITERINQTSENSTNASNYSSMAREKLIEGNEQMSTLLLAMDEINSSSEQISKIIKTIEDISFQTNILALNAAVEAARAGAAGKGFAVVADEVRNLATKSSNAAKETTGLIENSINSVQKGVTTANLTAQTLQEVMAKAKESSALIAEIAVTAKEQAEAIEQINTGIEQISSVVQTNSATAEQSAAASEELSTKAEDMHRLIGRFTLK